MFQQMGSIIINSEKLIMKKKKKIQGGGVEMLSKIFDWLFEAKR